jgi:cobalt/nickel transport system ATP-binding protein
MNTRIGNILRSSSCPQNCDLSPAPLPQGSPVLECREIDFSYHTGVPAVAGVSFSVQAGESVALLGPNGSGKTTLLKLLTGLLEPDAGEIRLAGKPLDKALAREVFRTIGFLFQDSQDQLFNNFVAEDVAYGLKHLGLSPREVEDRVALALHLTEAQHLARRPIHHLSGGEMKRVALAGLIAMRSPLLVLDEPQNALDPASSEHLIELIEHLHRDHGYAFLTVTHKMDYVPRLAQRVIVMDQGHVLCDGGVREVLTDIPLLERARLAAPSITRYVYERRLRRGLPLTGLPLTVEEALAAQEE